MLGISASIRHNYILNIEVFIYPLVQLGNRLGSFQILHMGEEANFVHLPKTFSPNSIKTFTTFPSIFKGASYPQGGKLYTVLVLTCGASWWEKNMLNHLKLQWSIWRQSEHLGLLDRLLSPCSWSQLLSLQRQKKNKSNWNREASVVPTELFLA